jgi:hypothetical protein
MYTFFETYDVTTQTTHFFDLMKAIPKEELYRLVVDGRFHAKEKGWVGYENREPGCLKSFFDAFLFICQDTEAPLTVEYIQTIQALCSDFKSNTNWRPGMLYQYTYPNTDEFKEQLIRDHSFTIPHERATVAGITEYLNGLYTTAYGAVGSLSYEGTKIVPGAFGFKDNQKLAEYIFTHMRSEGKFLLYHASRTEVYSSLVKIVCNYQKEIALALNKNEKLLIIAKHIQHFERLHPFSDLNGRTFVNLLLNRMLMQNEFSVAIFEEPNLFDFYSGAELVGVIKKGIRNTEKLIKDKTLFDFDTNTMSATDKQLFSSICLNFTEGMTLAKEKIHNQLMFKFQIENYREQQLKAFMGQHAKDNKDEIEKIKKQYPKYGYQELFQALPNHQVIKDGIYFNQLLIKLNNAIEGKISVSDLRYQLEIDYINLLGNTESSSFKTAAHNYLSKVIIDLDKMLAPKERVKSELSASPIIDTCGF